MDEPVTSDGAGGCPLPQFDTERIVMGHGGGGVLSAELIESVLLPAYGDVAATGPLLDAARLARPDGDLAFSTDSYVVRPRRFPGGDIGMLAVNGTVNDLAMVGARPIALSVAMVIEEGFEIAELRAIAASMGSAARRAGVGLVTGDTKVVERGAVDGIFVTTSGVGVIPVGVSLHPSKVRPGDVVVLSGPIGCHGIAVLSERDGLSFATSVRSDTAPLHELATSMVTTAPGAVRVMRDPTRGGVAASLSELAAGGDVGIELDADAVPVPEPVGAACAFLGLDPLEVANEGVLVAVVAPDHAEAVLARMRQVEAGAQAVAVGRVNGEHRGRVVARTALGARRLIEAPLGEQLPRIC